MPPKMLTPVVFIHGLWMHSRCWEHWAALFRDAGYPTLAPGWPGEAATVEESRRHPETMTGYGIGRLTDHYQSIIAELPATPIVVGHCVGGLIAQRLLGRGFALAAVAITPVQFQRVLRPSMTQVRSLWPVLGHPGLRTKTWGPSPETFHRVLANGVSSSESDRMHRQFAIPTPVRPVLQVALANLNPRTDAAVDTRSERGPLLMVAGAADRMVPETLVRSAHKLQRRNSGVTELSVFNGRGHSMTADHGWREIADTTLTFLARHGFSPSTGPSLT